MKKVLVLHTGGTIAMSEDRETGAVKPGYENPLNVTIKDLINTVDISIDDYLNLPSPHMTPELMFKLLNRVEEKVENEGYDGIVITHGTDTLEETAYLLDLLFQKEIPIVVTGAMRSSNELGSDGPYNLISSIKVATSDLAVGKGVLVVLNDEIHTAKNVTKTHTSNIATFQSPQYGPIGIVTKRGVQFHHRPIERDRYHIEKLSKKVVLLKAYAGMQEELIEGVGEIGIDGLVIEALGQGNLPPKTVPAIKKLIAKGIPIVLVSRCFNGMVQDIYGYEGGGKHLKELGVIFSNGLNGQKARLKLMVTLEQTSDTKELQTLFNI
ncbi:asparaginase [Pseudalkalibacillus caeni]|uniref:asparaginase n=1 Tax=Exobacillus caeni TaxID=2574798 RepID=A0A5R9EZR1_9BACL|nr:asparaginase [Pseudalkalibacillus caeni]TLS35610.1 asparaginase [Pseudalkalibacillus caeni]